MQEKDELFMRRALQLARLGGGNVAPNPFVGCVLVHPELGIIGEGWHQQYGGPHAEVNAVNSVSDKSLISNCTAYVNLEPCSHFGKTPPCADLLIETGIKKVVVCNLDPNPLVAGKGIAKLKGHGIEVETGILEDVGRILNRFFFKAQEEKRPFITLKWAQTADGFIARKDGSSKWISSSLSRLYVHKMRSEHQSIWVGKNTLLLDNPKLNVRGWRGKNPIRIVIDPNLELPENLNVLSDGESPTWIFNSIKDEVIGSNRWISNQESSNLSAFLHQLLKEGISSVFVEGGTKLMTSFLNAGLWDEAIVFASEMKFGEGLPAPALDNGVLRSTRFFGKDNCRLYHKNV